MGKPGIMEQEIFVIGAGGHAKVIIDAIQAGKLGTIMGAVDPYAVADKVVGVTVIKEPEEILLKKHPSARFVIAVGDIGLRRKIADKLRFAGDRLLTVVHPSASVAASVSLEAGCMVCAGAIINADAKVGANTIVNTGAVVEHDCIVGACSHIAPMSCCLGGATVGDETLVGAQSVILPGKSVGRRVVVGAHSTVCSDVSDGEKVVGTPAKSYVNKT